MLADPAWQGILEVADDVDASVIVVGSRGLKGVKELIEHSMSRALAAHASRPVLVIPPAGSQSSVCANTKMPSSPNQKVGSESASMASAAEA